MARKIVIDNSNGEVRAAVIEEGKLADLFIERSKHPSVLGNIYKGKVENVLPGMQAAFVDIGLEKNAFLYVDDATASLPDIVKSTRNGDEVELPKSIGKSIKELLKPGQEVLVQVTKEAIGTKGARVVTDVTLAGRYVVLIPSVNYVGVSRKIVDDSVRNRLRDLAHRAKPRGMGLIVRTVAEEQTEEEVVRDIEFLNRAWKKIRAKAARAKAPYLLHYDADLVYRMARDYFGDDVSEFTVNTATDYSKVSDLLHIDEGEKDPRIRLYTDKKPVFEAYGIEEEIWKATRRKVWMNSGGYLIFDTTEALTVIDVNTGKFTGNKDLADTAFRNNMEAAAELARQIRLRNIGGILIADFIDMESEDHRRRVIEELEKHLSRDKAKTSVLGITKLGLIEMTRKKSQQGLVELTHRVCDVCDGRGKVISEETLALRAERLIKREAAATDMQALLIGLNPYVAEELSQNSGASIKELEEQTMRDIFIKSDPSLGRDDVKVIAAGSLEEVLMLVHPLKKGETVEVHVNGPIADKPDQGIAIYKELPIHIEDGAQYAGTTVKAKITRVFKGYAKARVEARREARPVFKAVSAPEDDLILEVREPSKQRTAAPAPKAAEEAIGIEAMPEDTGMTAADATIGQETKKKRRRRRHRRGSKEKAAALEAAASGLTAEDSLSQAVEPSADNDVDTTEPDLTSIAAKEAVPEEGAVPTAAKKRRRRRHRSRKQQAPVGLPEAGGIEPSLVVEDPSAASAPSGEEQVPETGATEPVVKPTIEEGKGLRGNSNRRGRPARRAAKPSETDANASLGSESAATADKASSKAEGSDVGASQEAGKESNKPKRQYRRRPKSQATGASQDSPIDMQPKE